MTGKRKETRVRKKKVEVLKIQFPIPPYPHQRFLSLSFRLFKVNRSKEREAEKKTPKRGLKRERKEKREKIFHVFVSQPLSLAFSRFPLPRGG
jgi:hypothetical protein